MIIKIINDVPKPLSPEQAERARLKLAARFKGKVISAIPETDVSHSGFFEYLTTAWANHYSVVIRPDDIWMAALCEIAEEVNKHPATFRDIFTRSTVKQDIMVPTSDVTTIDPALVVQALAKLMPANVNSFVPVFSTTTPACKLAMHVALCDVASPYYNYGTFLCGIPAVEIKGTEEDWETLEKHVQELKLVFACSKKVVSYLDRVYYIAEGFLAILNGSKLAVGWLDKMVKLTRCGSGSQYELTGWINKLTMSGTKIQLEGLPPHIAKMDYTNSETGRKFTLYCGLMGSRIVGDFMVPDYHSVVCENS